MNITELDSFNLADTVKFHDRLNHRLWDSREHLHPEVHAKLLEIARDFQEFLGVPDLDVKDITVSGSNAAYNYTSNSDIDLHLVVDLPEADHSEVYRELFDAKKYQYNDQHNIRIGGYDVELYVQNPNQEHHSQGIYSLLRNAWISVPKRRKPNIDDISVRSKYEDLAARIEQVIASGDVQRMNTLKKKIKTMRQSGLERQGEFGSDNLAFKMLRNNGLIQRLFDAATAARDRELSLAEKARPRTRTIYGFAESPDGVDPTTKMFLEEPVAESPDGVNPSTSMFLTETDTESVLQEFIKSTARRLGIRRMPKIFIHKDEDWSEQNHSFGMYKPQSHELHVSLTNRHLLDVLRTTAHELVHCAQHQRNPMPSNAGETGSPWENQAHAVAGVIMRDFADANPHYFQQHALGESASGYIPKNKKEARDPRYSMAVSVDIKPGQVGKEANKLALKTGRNGEPALLMKSANLREGKIKLSTDPNWYGAEVGDYKATGPVVNISASQLVGFEPDDKMNQPKSKANVEKIVAGLKKGDKLPPLLVRKYKNGYQVLDGHHRFWAYKLLGAKEIPAQIVPAKDIEELKEERMPQPSQGQGKYRDLNKPLGPETPPTMPAGTVRVDVSDVYDWYKLGQHISNLKGLGKHDFGKGPPSTIVSFGDEETEHKYIQDLEKTGLTTTDIDPVDPKQPPGMKRQKTDPTYNVSEGIIEETAEELEELAQFSKVIADSLSQSYSQYIQNPQSAEYVKQQIAQPITDGSTYKALMPVIGIGSVPGANTYTSPGLELAKKFVNIVVAYFPPPDESDYYGQTAAAPAVYDPQSRTVAINKDFLSNPAELAVTIAHEVQHGIDDLKSRKGLSVKTDQQDVDLSYYDQGKAFKYTQSAGSADQAQKFKSYLAMPHEVNARFTEVINDLKQRIEQEDIRNIGSEGLSELARTAFAQHYMHEVFPNGAKDPGYKRLLSRVYAWLSKYYKDRLTSGSFKQPQAVELAESLAQEFELFEIDRRGMLKALGAGAMAAAVPAVAQAGPFVDVVELNKTDPKQVEQVWIPRLKELTQRSQAMLRKLIAAAGPQWAPQLQGSTIKVVVSQNYAQASAITRQITIDLSVFWDAPDAALAFAIAHELGHIAMEHGSGTDDESQDYATQVKVAKKYRQDELDADTFAVQLCKALGYNKAEVFKFITQNEEEYRQLELMTQSPTSTHPTHKSRIERARLNGFQLSRGGIEQMNALKQHLAEDDSLVERLRQELALFEEDLFEVKMTSKNLAQLAKAVPGATVGLEFEMIVPNTSSDYGGDMEPDYDQDERVRDIDDCVNFFDDGDYNYGATIRRLRSDMEEAYMNWKIEQIDEDWANNGFEFFTEYLDREEPFDEEDYLEQAIDMALTKNPGLQSGTDEYDEAVREALDEINATYYTDQWDEQGRNYENALDEFREERMDDISESDWLAAEGIRFASDVESNYDVTWPYWNSPESEKDAKEVALEFMNAMGYDTIAVGDYHGYGGGYELWNGSEWVKIGSNKPMDAFTVEPDGSLSGDNSGDIGLEFVSPPIPLEKIGETMAKVQQWAAENGVYTGKRNSTSLHTNISIPGYDLDKLDYLKAAILLGDEYVLRQFDRIGNTYAKPAIEKIKQLVKQKPEQAQELLDRMKGQLNAAASKLIHSGQTDKYTSINTKDNRIEFRSPGGDYLSDIANNPQKMQDTINRMVVVLDAAMNPEKFKEEYQKKLYKMLTGQESGREAKTGAKREVKASDKDLLNIFSRYAAGELPKQALKSFVRQAQLERDVAKKKQTGKMWWRVNNPPVSFGEIEVVASSKEEAIEKALGPDGYPSWANTRGSIQATPVRPYQEPMQQSTGPVSSSRPSNPDGNYVIVDMADETTPVYRFMAANDEDALLVQQQYSRDNPGPMWKYKADPNQRLGQPGASRAAGFQNELSQTDIENRLGWPDQTGDANYEVINRSTMRPVFKFVANTDQDAQRKYSQILDAMGMPQETEDYGWRAISQPIPGSTLDLQRQRAAAAQSADAAQGGLIDIPIEIPDTAPRTLTTPGQPQQQFTGEWKVVDNEGRELYRFSGVGNNQSDANRVAIDWLRRNPRQMQAGVEVLPVMA